MEHPNGHAVVNIYARHARLPATGAQMGPQSQRRLTLQERTHQLQANSNKSKRKAGQLTLFGDRAFEPEKDCVVCRGRLIGIQSHKGHHRLCSNNRRTRGIVSTVTLQQNKIDKALKNHFNTPLAPAEKASGQHMTEEAVATFFTKRTTSLGKKPTEINPNINNNKIPHNKINYQ